MPFCSAVRAALVAAVLLAAASCSGGGDPAPEPSQARPHAGDGRDRPIVFSSDRLGSVHLWLMAEDGDDLVRLTSGDGADLDPAWSPDGRWVAFTRIAEDETSDLWVVAADGGEPWPLTSWPGCESSPDWSPDGRRVVFAAGDCSDGDSALHEVDVDPAAGSAVPRAAARLLVEAPALWPDWSADGRRLVYTVPGASLDGMRLWVAAADGSAPRRLRLPGVGAASEATWSPDGTRVAFVAATGGYADWDPATWNEDVHVAAADGAGRRRLTTAPGNDHWPPAWSPDGERLAYSADGDADGEIAVVEVRTGEVTALTDDHAEDLFPAWRPAP